MRRKREAFDPTDDLFEGLPSAKHAAIRLRDDSGDSDSSHADADGAASEAIVEPAADSVPVAETAARLSAREPSAASSAQGVTDEAGLPLWMRTAAARIIGDHTPPISALALDRRLEAALGRMGVRRCFPVQAAVVPMVLASAASSSAGDICCCAPTGSGKTLAYSLPLLQHLLGKIDADTIDAVVNYDPPSDIRSYLHRVGADTERRPDDPAQAIVICTGGPPPVAYVRALQSVMEPHFPERLRMSVVYPIPWMMKMVVNGFIAFLPRVTRDKFRLCATCDELLELTGLSLSEVPVDLQGGAAAQEAAEALGSGDAAETS
ncbi:hypothetical protein EMIHUDRAFT_195220 [Emiliania huxleyi CCMP1516]|uniref:ATP-dependent RNA helicase n=2 Tax=Emiliania huxleyi TaxID=2903 RepID=A0A0D3JH46_EMIH1|nr:hypothetical protein EMIHUDRAFT_195220 [Emiliania huxleyi CCMP1516]EOD22831.1 hypothetical protein EMIHUDRAFT_195220 [Emiliania huxleyi CCMP1516]|eukprot:XP_005775260.1 hypothetical protein EMIHUDRAFT_195220 [Emiliania huxleyi CCMP1516]